MNACTRVPGHRPRLLKDVSDEGFGAGGGHKGFGAPGGRLGGAW